MPSAGPDAAAGSTAAASVAAGPDSVAPLGASIGEGAAPTESPGTFEESSGVGMGLCPVAGRVGSGVEGVPEVGAAVAAGPDEDRGVAWGVGPGVACGVGPGAWVGVGVGGLGVGGTVGGGVGGLGVGGRGVGVGAGVGGLGVGVGGVWACTVTVSVIDWWMSHRATKVPAALNVRWHVHAAVVAVPGQPLARSSQWTLWL